MAVAKGYEGRTKYELYYDIAMTIPVRKEREGDGKA
jgi:hypothetical protein